MAVLNCCSVTNKQAGLEPFLLINKIDILIGTESRLDGPILNAGSIPTKPYESYRKDRNLNQKHPGCKKGAELMFCGLTCDY